MTPGQTIRAATVLQHLHELAGWETLGPRIEALRAAVSGGEGVTDKELSDLEEYAERWRALRDDLRAFYRALAPVDPTASVALWRVLHGGPRLEDWQHGKLARLWEEAVGTPPSVDLCPRRRREW